MRPITLDADISVHLGNIYLSGVAGVGVYHPIITGDKLALCYLLSCGGSVPEIILTNVLVGEVYEAVKSGKALAVVPVYIARKLKRRGLKIDGVLLYGTGDFWHTLLDGTPLKRYVDILVEHFKGHIALLRVVGKFLYGFDFLLDEYGDVYLYHDYGLPDEQ